MKEYLVLLRQILTERFDEEELRTLCFDLGIRYDDLPGRGKVAKARELVAHLERRERIPDCIEVGKLSRPDIIWEEVQLAWLEAAQEVASDPRRFQPLIDELQATIGLGEGRVERQRERIAAGLMEERQRRAEEQARRHERERVRIVGQPPLDVANYFKDRQRELEELTNALVEPTTRLVSVIGHGGMGKTALTCKALQDLERHRWPQTDEDLPVDGIVYLSTRTAGISLERLFLDCAKLLGGKSEEHLNAVWTNPQLESEEKVTRLLNALSDGRYVILLDNLEDLLNDQGQFLDDDLQLFFDQALTAGHGAQLVVTSRVGLAFQREVMRFDRQVKLLKGLPMEDGVALLRELDPNGDYGLRDALEEELAEAVRLTYGVPRALEVLAGILANDPFVSLSEVMETFYEQEDVVQALIEENYRRLDRDARQVIEALAVFGKPVPVLAVDYLLEPFAPGLDVPVVIRRLTRTNIVSVDRVAKLLTLHPIDQDYAYNQLSEKGPESVCIRKNLELRAADYYAQLRTPDETWKSIDDLEPQLNEFEHRVRAEAYDQACKILDEIDKEYMHRWGHYPRLAKLRGRLQGQLIDPELRTNNLYRLVDVHYRMSQFERVSDLCKQGLDLARRFGMRRLEGKLLELLGRALSLTTGVEYALDLLENAVDIARQENDLEGECGHLITLGVAYLRMRQVRESMKLLKEALSIAREVGDRRREGIAFSNLGFACGLLGRIDHSIRYYEQALAIAREIGDRAGEGIRLANIGFSFYRLGRLDLATDCYREALDIARATGSRKAEAIRLARIGQVHQAKGDFEEAIGFYREALSIEREVNHRAGASKRLLGLSQSQLALGNTREARNVCREALAMDVPSTNYRAMLTLGIVLLHQRDSSARELFGRTHNCCRARLNKTADLYRPHYVLAAASIGQAVCDSRWADVSERSDLLAPAMDEYRRAMAITAAPGVVQEAIRNLELFQAAGIPGLEPVFELLERAEYEPGEDLPDILEYIETEVNG